MAKVFHFKTVLTGAAVAGMLFAASGTSQAAGLWGERLSALKTHSVSAQGASGWKWSLIQYRAYKYDQRLSRFFGRPVSPFCRLFC